MLFWGDFRVSRTTKIPLYITEIKKRHFGEIRALYFSTMKILGERIVMHILKSAVSTATAIRNLDSK